MKNKKYIFSGMILIVLAFSATRVNAQSWYGEAINQLGHSAGATGAGYSEPMDPRLIVSNIIRLLLSLIGTILFVLIAYSGFKWMTAQGNEEQVASAKKTIVNSTIGLFVILSAYALTIMITNLALGRNLGSNSNQGTSLDDALRRGMGL